MLHFTQLWNLTSSVDVPALESGIKSAAQFAKQLFQGKGQKRFIGFSHRLIPPQQTLKTLVKEKQKLAGITRVSDITNLDVIGIPTYVAIRPEACFATPLEEGRISIYNGKGFTKAQAKASALMEAFERRAGEPYARKPIIA